jgi:hypothetical protein
MFYRCYLLDDFDRITSFIALKTASDADAITLAKRYAAFNRKPFELWRGRQVVCRGP